MAFTFIHTADWQLGKPFRNFRDERVVALLEQARRDSVGRIAAIARNASAAHVVVAGDVFDCEAPSRDTIAKAFDQLAAARDVTWHLLPGNHDPARPAGLWEQLLKRGLPPNVRAHVEPKPVEIDPGVMLLPSPLTTKSQTRDTTAWLDGAATPPGMLRIGLAHGSIRDFASAGESAAIIDPARARKAGLDYLALGDWHGTSRIDARTWYSGTPEPDRFPDNEPGFVLAVTLDAAGREPRVERIASAHFMWVKKHVELSDATALASVERALLTTAPQIDRLLVKLSIAGSVSALGYDAVRSWAHSFAERVCYLEADLSALMTALGEADLAALDLSEDVRRAAERLQAHAKTGDENARRVGEAALGWLVRLARDDARSANS